MQAGLEAETHLAGLAGVVPVAAAGIRLAAALAVAAGLLTE